MIETEEKTMKKTTRYCKDLSGTIWACEWHWPDRIEDETGQLKLQGVEGAGKGAVRYLPVKDMWTYTWHANLSAFSAEKPSASDMKKALDGMESIGLVTRRD